MFKKASIITAALAALGLSSQLLSAIPGVQIVEPAFAGSVIDFKHTINLADRERLLSQRMSKELLLVALGYNKKENLRNLQATHDMFSRVLKGLHYGDAELALVPVDDSNVLDKLSRVEEIWPLFEAALNDSVAAGHVLRDHVEIVAQPAPVAHRRGHHHRELVNLGGLDEGAEVHILVHFNGIDGAEIGTTEIRLAAPPADVAQPSARTSRATKW